MRHDLGDIDPLVNFAFQHLADNVDTSFREGHERYPKRMVKDLVDVVEWILLVDNRIEQNTKRPYVLLFSAVWLALQHFRRGVIWMDTSAYTPPSMNLKKDRYKPQGLHRKRTDRPDKNIKRSVSDVRGATKIDQLDPTFAV